jgi:basic amino acid/polyamine antiporter, APA family
MSDAKEGSGSNSDAASHDPTDEPAPRREIVQGHQGAGAYVRLRIPRVLRLRRVLGVPALFSSGYGNVGSSIYYALGVTTVFALGAAPLALLLAGAFFVLTCLSYTEGTVAVPEAGGASSFARRGFNEMVSFFTGWMTMLSYTATISISAFSAVGYMAVFFPPLGTKPLIVIVTVIIIALLILLNIIGVQEATRVSVIFAVIDLATETVVVIVGFIFLLNFGLIFHQIHLGVTPVWGKFLYSISVAMVAYTGIETISNVSEEAKDPGRTVPRAYASLIFAVLILFIGISLVALSAMPVTCGTGGPTLASVGTCPAGAASAPTSELSTTYLNDPVAGIAGKLPSPYDAILKPMVAFLAASILLIGANAGVLGVSRLSFSMGAHYQLPGVLYNVSRRFRTPHVTILVFGIIAMVLVLNGDVTDLSSIYAFAATITFTMAHLGVIGSRIKDPDGARPFKLPLNVTIKGREIPLISVIGGVGTFAIWIIIAATNHFGQLVGFPWMVIGLIFYVIYRRRLGLSLTKMAKRPPLETS